MTQKIAYAKPGDRLSARYVNRLVDGANLALHVLGPARSKRLPASDSEIVDLDENGDGDLSAIGTRVYTENSRITSTVRVEDPNDSDIYVNVERIDTVTLESSADILTLKFDNS
jgi:hypothetical protein